MEIKQHTSEQSMGQRGSLKGNFKNYMQLNENEKTTHSQMWNVDKTVLRRLTYIMRCATGNY